MIFDTTEDQLEEVQEGDAIQVGRAEESVNLPPAFPSSGEKAIATPAVRRIATEHNVDLKNVQGTGRDGRVLKEDILAYVSTKGSKQFPSAVQASPPKTAPVPAPQPSAAPIMPPINRALPDRKESIKGYTKTMIKTMTAANVRDINDAVFKYCIIY